MQARHRIRQSCTDWRTQGPLVERKERTHYAIDKATGRWKISSEQYNAPFVEYTPLWRFYPDMSATDIEECRYVTSSIA